MKLLTTLCLLATTLGFGQNVDIPDAALKAKLTSASMGIDINNDGEIQLTEAVSITGTLLIDGSNITDLTGIEAFANITGLDASSNQIETFTCQNIQLQYLDIKVNNLAYLDISNCEALSYLNCYNNQLTDLDVSTQPLLSVLYCGSNNLQELDVSANPELTTLDCGTNDLTALDITQNILLNSLYCYENNLTTLNLTANTNLELLSCGYNSGLTGLNFSNTPLLVQLNCIDTAVESLNLSMCPELQLLVCTDCEMLKSINLKNGFNDTFNTFFFNLSGLSSLQIVCVDDDESDFAIWVQGQVNPDVSVSDTCTMGTVKNTFEEIALYPNPVNDTMYFTGHEPAEVYIYTFTGQQAGHYENVTEIDFSQFGQGSYLLYIKQASGATAIKKVIKR